MTLSLRQRILIIVSPPLLLLIAGGIAGSVLLQRLTHRIDAILRENYDSIRSMEQLLGAAERLDASFQFAIAGKEDEAQKRFRDSWVTYHEQLAIEDRNITIFPDEPRLVTELHKLTAKYKLQGEQFYALPPGNLSRIQAYLGNEQQPGLVVTFHSIQSKAKEILRLNQDNMEQANTDAQRLARRSQWGFGIGMVLGLFSVGVTVWLLVRTITRPVESVTSAVEAIGDSQFHLPVPVVGPRELARLAAAFNAMTTRLRLYRQTDTERLLRAQQTSQATIDSFPDPIVVLDPEGHVELANPAGRDILGLPENSEVVWVPPESLTQPVADALQSQRPFLTEAFGQAISFRMSGIERAYLPQVRPIRTPQGDTLGAAIVLNDITPFRLLDQFKTDLVATMSHELKTPLTGVRLAVHVLLEEVIGELNPKQTELLIDARENVECLLRIIEHLLALARLEEGRDRIQLQPVVTGEFLQTIAEEFAPRVADKHLSIEVKTADDLPKANIDPIRFGQALRNLLDNAITYTPQGGIITLTATADSHSVKIRIEDTGIGIPAEHLPHVFERFFRVPERSAAQGTGLGLAIVREIVHLHRGEIQCSSSPGKGTVFEITLPRNLGNQ